jgi:hypothetical protein
MEAGWIRVARRARARTATSATVEKIAKSGSRTGSVLWIDPRGLEEPHAPQRKIGIDGLDLAADRSEKRLRLA